MMMMMIMMMIVMMVMIMMMMFALNVCIILTVTFWSGLGAIDANLLRSCMEKSDQYFSDSLR